MFFQVPYFELKVPPPLNWANSDTTVLTQTSHDLAISLRHIGDESPRRELLNSDFTLTERSSDSLLFIIYTHCNNKNESNRKFGSRIMEVIKKNRFWHLISTEILSKSTGEQHG